MIVVDETISYKNLPENVVVIPFHINSKQPLPSKLEEFYEFLNEKKKDFPTTASPSSSFIYEKIKKLIKDFKEEILFISLPKKFSKITEAFEEVAERLRKENIKARVFDSGQAFASIYFFVQEALKYKNIEETYENLKKVKDDIFLFGAPNLKFLIRTGRVGGLKGIGTKILDFFGFIPIFSIKEGKVKKERFIRKKSDLVDVVKEFVEKNIGYGERFYIHLSYGREEGVGEIKKELRKLTNNYIESRLSRGVAVSAGPNTIAVAIKRDGYEFIEPEIILLALKKFYEKIKKQKGLLNKLNVFPVIDSDTGNNLETTLRPVMKLKKSENLLSKINEELSRNACGYSGTCINAFFSGLLFGYEKKKREEKKEKGKDREIDKKMLEEMLKEATRQSYDSFKKVGPREGTILTTIRKTYETFKSADEKRIDRLFVNAYKKSVDAVLNPEERPEILKKKNVVDSGALAFTYFLEAFVEVLGRKEEIKSTKKKLESEITKQKMFFYYKPREAKTKGFCLEYRIREKNIEKITEKLRRMEIKELSVVPKKDSFLLHLHILPGQEEKVMEIMKEYELIKKSSLEQSFLTLAKNQFFMLAEKVKLIPNYVAWSGYWLGLRLLWPFREIKLARELRKYKELFSALLDNIPCKVLVIKDKVYSNLEDEELGELEEKLETILGSKTGETGEWKYVVKEGKSGEKIVILDKK